MRIAGVRADGNVWPLLGNDSSAVKLLEYPDLQIIFRERLFLANVLRGVLEGFPHDAIDSRARCEMRIQLCIGPASFVFLDQVRGADDLGSRAAHQDVSGQLFVLQRIIN